jgi:hypothetical protein
MIIPGLGAQIRDGANFLHVNEELVGACHNRLALRIFEHGIFEREGFIPLAQNKKVAEPILVRNQDAAHHGRLEVNLQGHGIR